MYDKEVIEDLNPDYFNPEDLDGFHEWVEPELDDLPIVDPELIAESGVVTSIFDKVVDKTGENVRVLFVDSGSLVNDHFSDNTAILVLDSLFLTTDEIAAVAALPETSDVPFEVFSTVLIERYGKISKLKKEAVAVKESINLVLVNPSDWPEDVLSLFVPFSTLKNSNFSFYQKLYVRYWNSLVG